MRQIVLDTETTGLNYRTGDRIVEIGCIEMLGRQRTGRTFHAWLNPGREVGPYDGFDAVTGRSKEWIFRASNDWSWPTAPSRVLEPSVSYRCIADLGTKHPNGSSGSSADVRRYSYLTSTISSSRKPPGLSKRTVSPSRAFSSARASGEIQLIMPWLALASSMPTIW